MRRVIGAALASGLLAGCGLLPGGDGEGIGWPFPVTDPAAIPTAPLPEFATLDVDAFGLAPKVGGLIVDPNGAGLTGVVLCLGPSEAEAVSVAVTDAAGAYSLSLDADALSGGSLLLWPFLPLTRFEPEGYRLEGVLLGGSDFDFKGVPAIYPVPPERDCR